MELKSISPAFAKALCVAQSNIEGAKKGKKNDHFKAKYADLAAVWEAVGSAFHEQGISILQFVTEAPSGFIGLETCLIFGETGEVISKSFSMPLKDPTNAQAAGSAITYARRYALSSVTGVCPEDDDGNAAVNGGPKNAPSGKAGSQAEKTNEVLSVKAAEELFGTASKGANSVEEMKKVYQATKLSKIPEPEKAAVLSKFADAIKAEKGKNN
jgi:hypothetical protein